MPPEDKQSYIGELSKILLEDIGRKEYYSPKEVEKSHRKSNRNFKLDFSCWGMPVFTEHEEFDKLHQQTGENCDYTERKSEMRNGISLEQIDFFEVDSEDIDAFWIDLSSVFEEVGHFFFIYRYRH